MAACSGDDSDGEADPDLSITTTTIVFTGDAGSPFCTELRDLALQDVLAEPAQTPADLETGFTTLLGLLQRAADAAPEELRADTALLVEGISALDDALRAVGYSYDALAESPEGPTVAAAVNDPTFGVAGDRIEAYKRQVCKL